MTDYSRERNTLIGGPQNTDNLMPQNTDDFNEGVATIMGKLHENFPTPIQLSANEIPNIPLIENDPFLSEKMDRFLGLTALHYDTAIFLLEEGYIRGEQVAGYTVLNKCILTAKGLAALERTPKFLKNNKRSIGEWFVSLGQDTAKDITKEAIKAAVRSMLVGG